MKVIYDISKLGEGYHQPLDKTGIFKVVENIAYGLATSSECDVIFCATRSFEALSGSSAYLKHHPIFSKVPLLCPRLANLRRALDRKLHEVNAEINDLRFFDIMKQAKRFSVSTLASELHKRIERKLLTQAYKLIKEDLHQLDARWLKQADIFHSPVYPLSREAKNVQRFLTVHDLWTFANLVHS